ncbi:hypothetical protein Phum_PHUM394510 [Pediculus humanus corporis]|uniref:Uncharacterized protein n=1 Tax=Pediculus humanus subsp. corporis TaxID=121224 RepID=E0VR77_PEDHC|nr:uncharacterized protein Phum_PHUM394510 [Pediculus humanus corporis]EEB15883.1 hypothetical protein Phum_PHUM394510 [Pediculus humanus corporis]
MSSFDNNSLPVFKNQASRIIDSVVSYNFLNHSSSFPLPYNGRIKEIIDPSFTKMEKIETPLINTGIMDIELPCIIKQEKTDPINNIQGLKDIIAEGKSFSAEGYLNEQLNILNWVPPQTKARGRLAPKSVIKMEEERKKLKKIMNERVQECIKQQS